MHSVDEAAKFELLRLMKKALWYFIFMSLVCVVWMIYASKVKEVERIEFEIQELMNSTVRDAEEKISELDRKKLQVKGVQTFNGILLAFLSAGGVGIFFVLQVLPAIAHRFTHAIYDSAEMVEVDPMHDARSLLAQGEYEAAIDAFREVAESDRMNRLPWVEMVKIQRENLKSPQAAVATLREALDTREWEVDDAAFLIFRLAEIYDEDLENREIAGQLLEQVCEEFGDTRHAANARHKLHEWSLT